jgi:hypothetical protein
MKKILFTLVVALFASFSMMAQETTKKCTKGEAAKCCASKTASVKTASTADLTLVMASSMKRQNVSKRECATSGAVSYFQKNVCSTSGKISYQEVEFDVEQRQFVNVSPNDIGDANQAEVIKVVNMEEAAAQGEAVKKASCSKKAGSAKCCSKAAKKAEGTN